MRFRLFVLVACLIFALYATQATLAGGKDLRPAALDFVNTLIAGDYQAAVALFDASVRGQVTPEALKQVWEGLLAQYGAFKSLGDPAQTALGLYQIVYVPAVFAKTTLDLKCVFAGEGLVGFSYEAHRDRSEPAQAAYVDPDRFTETAFEFGEPGFTLTGVLTMPKGDGPFPAVVLVQGSGPSDGDETVGPNKPFRDLAWGLASRGIAVFRHPKRTFVHLGKLDLKNLTVEEEAVADALAAIKLVAAQKGVGRVYLLGYSLGGMLAPRIARRASSLAGLIMLAVPARPLLDLILEQTRYLVSLDGKVDEAEKNQLQAVEALVAKVKAGQLKEGEFALGAARAYWDDLAAYDQVAAAKSLDLPFLILQGQRDYQVTMADFEIWQKAFAGRAEVRCKSYPGLNHLFMPGEGQPGPAEYETPGHVDAGVVADIAAWILG